MLRAFDTFVGSIVFVGLILSGLPARGESRVEGDLMAAMSAEKKLSEFVDFLELTDLAEILRLHGPFTVFAPTNDAIFRDLSRTEYRELKDLKNRGRLVRLLANHILSGSRTVEDIERARSFHSWTGQIFVHPGRGLSTDASRVVAYVSKDQQALNGLLNIMDGVLKPRSPTEEPAKGGRKPAVTSASSDRAKRGLTHKLVVYPPVPIHGPYPYLLYTARKVDLVQLQVSYPIVPPFPESLTIQYDSKYFEIVDVVRTDGKIVSLQPGQSEEGVLGVGYISAFIRPLQDGTSHLDVRVDLAGGDYEIVPFNFQIGPERGATQSANTAVNP